jgi:hypothetical protein
VCKVRVAQCVHIAQSGSRSQTSIDRPPSLCLSSLYICLYKSTHTAVEDAQTLVPDVCCDVCVFLCTPLYGEESKIKTERDWGPGKRESMIAHRFICIHMYASRNACHNVMYMCTYMHVRCKVYPVCTHLYSRTHT